MISGWEASLLQMGESDPGKGKNPSPEGKEVIYRWEANLLQMGEKWSRNRKEPFSRRGKSDLEMGQKRRPEGSAPIKSLSKPQMSRFDIEKPSRRIWQEGTLIKKSINLLSDSLLDQTQS